MNYNSTLNSIFLFFLRSISMAQVDTSLSDEEIVAKALSEHLKQVTLSPLSSQRRRNAAWRDQAIRWVSHGFTGVGNCPILDILDITL